MKEGISTRTLLLASGSPRRRKLLEQVGVKFKIVHHEIDEKLFKDESVSEAVKRIALHKAEDVGQRYPHCFVLSADTTVVLPSKDNIENDRILGKPRNREDAVSMLLELQGQKHQVLTAFCLSLMEKGIKVLQTVTSEVEFRTLSVDEINAYVDTQEPLDKAGAYAIQGKGAAFIKGITGSYTNIVGLPLCEVLEELHRYNLWSPCCLI